MDGYEDHGEDGVAGYGGKLDIRPPYQREFIYKDKQRDAVIDTVLQGFPLGLIYWATKSDGNYELLDGQQRTVSICQYVGNKFAFKFQGHARDFNNLPATTRERILNYELLVYVCDGSHEDKLEWFKTINIAGEELKAQELRNAVYSGPWLTDMKRHFSKTNCPACRLGAKYLSVKEWQRQECVELVLGWLVDRDGRGSIEELMQSRQEAENCAEEWQYFEDVIGWAKKTFPHHRPAMKKVDWGTLYNAHKDDTLDPAALEGEIDRLMKDGDVGKKEGIYRYVLGEGEKWLSLRSFDDSTRQTVYAKQNGVCPLCGKRYALEEMEADHVTPWSEGGKTVESNCQMLCRECNRRKGAR